MIPQEGQTGGVWAARHHGGLLGHGHPKYRGDNGLGGHWPPHVPRRPRQEEPRQPQTRPIKGKGKQATPARRAGRTRSGARPQGSQGQGEREEEVRPSRQAPPRQVARPTKRRRRRAPPPQRSRRRRVARSAPPLAVARSAPRRRASTASRWRLKPGQMDPVGHEALAGLRAVGLPATDVRVVRIYFLEGSLSREGPGDGGARGARGPRHGPAAVGGAAATGADAGARA